ncbi:MAG: peptidoglycan DD-metalloendopeptidase family protein [Alphaproteobacteria bacterium]|nr:peptidoglycan DD-metalloendopeptidase family protein [Alphaproteobacteria bacterium]
MRSPSRALRLGAAALFLALAGASIQPRLAAAEQTEDERRLDSLKKAEREARDRIAELKRREEQLAADPRKAEELATVRRDRQLAGDQAERLHAEIAALGDHLLMMEAAQKEQDEVRRRLRQATERAAEQQKREDEAGQREERLRRERREAVEREQDQERELRRLEDQARRLVAEEGVKRAALGRESERRDQVVAALLRLSGNEPAFLVAMPGPPLDNVQGALAFRYLEQDLRKRSMVLNASLQSLAEARAAIDDTRRKMDGTREALAAEKARIERMLADSADDQRRAAGQRQKEIELAEKLRAEARDREELIAALVKDRREREAAEARAREEARKAREAEERRLVAEAKARAAQAAQQAAQQQAAQQQAAQQQAAQQQAAQQAARPGIAPPDGAPAPAKQLAMAPAASPPAAAERPRDVRAQAPARGAMLNPVAGRIVRQFGQTDDAGTASKGLVFNANPGARVLAPYDGQVVYAGPFRGYGRILIIEHGGGYHTMLSGLGRIDCAVGQWVVAGEPLAIMGEQGGAGLYVELRRDGQPVNPVPWLASGNG